MAKIWIYGFDGADNRFKVSSNQSIYCDDKTLVVYELCNIAEAMVHWNPSIQKVIAVQHSWNLAEAYRKIIRDPSYENNIEFLNYLETGSHITLYKK